MSTPSDRAPIAIRPFGQEDWAALWAVRFAHLAEAGIVLADATPPERSRVVPEDDPEWDFHHIEQVYLRGMGNFWLARAGDRPVGYVGAQDVAGKLREKTQHDAYSLGPGEGDPRWVMGELDTIKATAAKIKRLR